MQTAIIAFIVSLLSLVYELSFAHVMSTLFGDVVYEYIMSTGIFIFFLGIGALAYEKLPKKYLKFYQIEFALSLLALVTIFLPYIFINIFPPLLAKISCWSLLAILAFATGIELPLLLSSSKSKNITLSADYLGMAFAGFIFPLVLLPYLGTVQILILASLINNLLAQYVCFKNKTYKKIYLTNFALYSFIFYSSDSILTYLEGLYIGNW